MVTGVASLLLAIDNGLKPDKIKTILRETADPIDTDKSLGNGCGDKNGCRLNAFKAVQRVLDVEPPTIKDIWTTSAYCYCPAGGGPGGGLDDHELVVGGWGDSYYSLIEFDLSGMPTHASSARLELFPFTPRGGSTTGMYLDRITEFWDWKTMGTGSDNDRLWWADRPNAVQWIPGALPAPTIGSWYGVDITDLYNAWQSGVYPNYGLQLRPASISNRWNEFYSSDYMDDPSLRPRLVVVE